MDMLKTYHTEAREKKLVDLYRKFSLPVSYYSEDGDRAMAAALDLPDSRLVEYVRNRDMPWLLDHTSEGVKVDALSGLTLCVGNERWQLAPFEIMLSYLFGKVNTSLYDEPWFSYKEGENKEEDKERSIRTKAREHIKSTYKNAEDWASWVLLALRLDPESDSAKEVVSSIQTWTLSLWK